MVLSKAVDIGAEIGVVAARTAMPQRTGAPRAGSMDPCAAQCRGLDRSP